MFIFGTKVLILMSPRKGEKFLWKHVERYTCG